MTGQDEDIRPVGYDEDIHQPFDVQAQKGEYAMWKLMGAMGFLVILALIVFFIYQPGARDRDDPVVISPSKTALKIPAQDTQPEPINDKAIYSAGQTGTGTEPVEIITPEAPIKLPEKVDVVVAETAQPELKKVPDTVKPPKTVTEVPAQRPIASPATQTKPRAPGTSNNAPGTYLLQVASLRSYEEAEATWNRITAKHNFLRGQAYDIKRVDLNEKGVYYRLRIDGLSSREQANTVCGKLKSNGQACFPTGR